MIGDNLAGMSVAVFDVIMVDRFNAQEIREKS